MKLTDNLSVKLLYKFILMFFLFHEFHDKVEDKVVQHG